MRGTPAASAYGLMSCQTTFSQRTSPPIRSARLTGRIRALLQRGSRHPRVDRNLHPIRHWGGANPAVLANQIDDAPPTVTLLDVGERKSGDLGSPEPTAQEDSKDRSIAQPLSCRGVGRT